MNLNKNRADSAGNQVDKEKGKRPNKVKLKTRPCRIEGCFAFCNHYHAEQGLAPGGEQRIANANSGAGKNKGKSSMILCDDPHCTKPEHGHDRAQEARAQKRLPRLATAAEENKGATPPAEESELDVLKDEYSVKENLSHAHEGLVMGEITHHYHSCLKCNKTFSHTHEIRTEQQSRSYDQLCKRCVATKKRKCIRHNNDVDGLIKDHQKAQVWKAVKKQSLVDNSAEWVQPSAPPVPITEEEEVKEPTGTVSIPERKSNAKFESIAAIHDLYESQSDEDGFEDVFTEDEWQAMVTPTAGRLIQLNPLITPTPTPTANAASSPQADLTSVRDPTTSSAIENSTGSSPTTPPLTKYNDPHGSSGYDESMSDDESSSEEDESESVEYVDFVPLPPPSRKQQTKLDKQLHCRPLPDSNTYSQAERVLFSKSGVEIRNAKWFWRANFADRKNQAIMVRNFRSCSQVYAEWAHGKAETLSVTNGDAVGFSELARRIPLTEETVKNRGFKEQVTGFSRAVAVCDLIRPLGFKSAYRAPIYPALVEELMQSREYKRCAKEHSGVIRTNTHNAFRAYCSDKNKGHDHGCRKYWAVDDYGDFKRKCDNEDHDLPARWNDMSVVNLTVVNNTIGYVFQQILMRDEFSNDLIPDQASTRPENDQTSALDSTLSRGV